ncbi:DUF4127 family protein [Paenibacillus flagellatus]|uniref:DUF4127 domain-containing protein n=1 Tax=Paenibacillus flagellatus TaxID=2211139 RepID=A0A2V5K8J4_9BACL|nr:DUF4127 family protein [Paenibacillus flagellatus]PYI55192.1 hypothetical protein DLM86_11760 [Paenibacillus flagellatus]
MQTIVYVPLDERPCNYRYPQYLASMTDLTLRVPDIGMLGRKKTSADTDAVRDWLLDASKDADALIVSVDMLVHGGIVPSRLHHRSEAECLDRLAVLKTLKERNPKLRTYAFNLITRVPAYSSSEEEPDYYADYGNELYTYGWLKDKAEQETLDAEEAAKLEAVTAKIPADVLDDFLTRRKTNAFVNAETMKLTRDGVIDFLIIPLDDNSKYGFSPLEQRKLSLLAEELDVNDRVMIYPGADEIGCTLFARAFCEAKGYVPKAFVRYSSVHGPFVVPKYEDRSLGESIKYQLTAAGAVSHDNSCGTDFVLMTNSPPVGQKEMAECSTPYGERNRAYFSETNTKEFVQAIRHYIREGHMVALADVAVSNGSDHPFMKLVARAGILHDIAAYAAWNTSGNTLGTVISHAIVESYYRGRGDVSAERLNRSRAYYYFRLIEDWGYQAIVRKDVIHNELPKLGASYYELDHVRSEVYAVIRRKLEQFFEQYVQEGCPGRVRIEDVHLPWSRMFEVGFETVLETE